MAVQWLRHHVSTAQDMGSISGQGTKILQDAQCSQKIGGNKKKLLKDPGGDLSARCQGWLQTLEKAALNREVTQLHNTLCHALTCV